MKKNSIRKLTIAGVSRRSCSRWQPVFHTGAWREVLAGAAYGKYSGGCCTWTGMGGRHCILRKPAP